MFLAGFYFHKLRRWAPFWKINDATLKQVLKQSTMCVSINSYPQADTEVVDINITNPDGD